METLIKSMLGKDQEFVVDILKELMKNEEVVEIQNKEIDNLKEENYYLKNKLENKRDIIEDVENELDKYERKFEDAKKAVILKEIEIDELERFVAQQTEEMNILKDNNHSMTKQISENIMMEKKINVQKGVINELKEKTCILEDEKSTKSADEHDEQTEILEREVTKLVLEVKELEQENKKKISRLEEMDERNEYLEESLKMEKEKNKADIKDDNINLMDELHMFETTRICDSCGNTFVSCSDLETHQKKYHEKESEKNLLHEKLNLLENNILKQKSNFFSRVIELKETEEKYICNCKSFCKIRQRLYNWSKPISTDILEKSRVFLGGKIEVEAEANAFKCKSCEISSESQEDLERHSQTMHPTELLQVYSSNPWGLTFLDLGQ